MKLNPTRIDAQSQGTARSQAAAPRTAASAASLGAPGWRLPACQGSAVGGAGLRHLSSGDTKRRDKRAPRWGS